MKKRVRLLLVITILSLSIVANSTYFVSAEDTPKIKNVIFMIPDGGGFALYDFAKAVKEAGGFNEGLYPNSTKITDTYMYLKDYLIGTETTHSANNAVTDSAAAGTALSSGYKTNNGYIGIDPSGRPHATLLEAAQLAGKRTGIVATYHWSHATPAAFTAHNESRENTAILSEQIVNQGLDVVLGVGFGSQWGSIDEAVKRGYTITESREDLEKVTPGTKIWGNHHKSSIPLDIELTTEPTLAQMTAAAIRALDGSDKGFFLMVEGSKVDSGGHSNNILNAVSEYIAFDEAFKVALDYAKGRKDTIVIAAPDHDTGGLNLPNADDVGGNPNWSDYADAVAKVKGGENITKEEESLYGISWTTGGHTNRRCPVWMYAPEGIKPPKNLSETPGDTSDNRKLVIDNTEIAPYLADLMGLDLDAATEELFVDVTDLGTFNPKNNTFTFKDKDIRVKANQSVAIVQGRPFDLDGKVAVYSMGRFYVPKSLIEDEGMKIKTARYKDQATGRILVKGQLHRVFAGEQVTLVMYKSDSNPLAKDAIGYIDQKSVNSDGSYAFTFKFLGDAEDYNIGMYLGNQTVTDSITEATASYSWLDSAVLLHKEGDSLISGEVSIKNYDIEGLTYCIGLAFYDANNKLIQLKLSDVKAIDKDATLDNLKASMPDETAMVKVFVWSNYTQMIPLCEKDYITVQ